MNDDRRLAYELIDPARAKRLLASGPNRNIKRIQVDKYARSMVAGQWNRWNLVLIHTETPTASNPTGEVLTDGFHRCEAVAKTGVTIECIIAYGAPRVDAHVNTGKSRTFADHLQIHHLIGGNFNAVAAAVRWFWRRRNGIYDFGGGAPGGSMTNAEGVALLNEHPGLEAAVRTAAPAAYRYRLSHGMAGCLYYEMACLDTESAAEFWADFGAKGDLGLTEGHPIYALRKKLEANLLSHSTKMQRHVPAAYIIKAWNAYIGGEKINQLRWRRGGASPEPFPQIEGPEE